MPGNAFIRFMKNASTAQFGGESMQEGHEASQGWLAITDWSWDIEADTSFLKGQGAAVGRPQPGTLSITHNFDNSSSYIMTNIVKGTHFEMVQIDMLKQTGDVKPQTFFTLKAGAVFVTKVSSKSGEDGAVSQDVEFVFKEIALGYRKQDQSGGLNKTTKEFKWNIAKMNLVPSDLVTITMANS